MIIALTGLAGSGKSTAAKHLVEKHGFTLVKFAAPLKDMLRPLGLGDREIEGDLKEVPCALLGGRTPRHAMQTLGTEWGRECMDPDLWIRIALKRAAAELDQGGKVVMDDCRFPNEAEAVLARGGSIVRITRDGEHVQITRNSAGDHASEGAELPWTWEILNNKSIDGFHAAVDGVLWHLKERGKCA